MKNRLSNSDKVAISKDLLLSLYLQPYLCHSLIRGEALIIWNVVQYSSQKNVVDS